MLVPKSRGTVTLNSSNPFDPPILDPNYLQVPTDMTDIVQGNFSCYLKCFIFKFNYLEIQSVKNHYITESSFRSETS